MDATFQYVEVFVGVRHDRSDIDKSNMHMQKQTISHSLIFIFLSLKLILKIHAFSNS